MPLIINNIEAFSKNLKKLKMLNLFTLVVLIYTFLHQIP